MAGKQDIKAGRAYVELLLKDAKFVKGLDTASRRLKDFGEGMTSIGASMMKAGAAISATLGAAIVHFVKTGDALGDISARTGVAASTLAEFTYAAERSETSIEEVEKALRKMAQAIQALRDGTKSAKSVFHQLGLTAQDFVGKSPDEQFALIAEHLKDISDITKRTTLAMEIFGKSGANLLPLMENLQQLREEARREGLIPSEGAIQSAGMIDDAMKKLRASISAVVFEIGHVFAPTVLEALYSARAAVKSIKVWVSENLRLVMSLGKVGLALTAAGAAIYAFGKSMIFLGGAFAGLKAIFTLVIPMLSAILSPVGIVTAGILAIGAALAGGVVYWARFTESGRAAMAGLMSVLSPFLNLFQQTWQGVVDAIATGNLALAGQIAITGLKVVLLQGLAAILSSLQGAIVAIANAVASGFAVITDAALSASNATMDVWSNFKTGVLIIFDTLVSGLKIAANEVWSFLAQGWSAHVDVVSAVMNNIMAIVNDALAFVADGLAKVNGFLDTIAGVAGLETSRGKQWEKTANDLRSAATTARGRAAGNMQFRGVQSERQVRDATRQSLINEHTTSFAGRLSANQQEQAARDAETNAARGRAGAVAGSISGVGSGLGIAAGVASGNASASAVAAQNELDKLTRDAAIARKKQQQQASEAATERDTAFADIPDSSTMQKQAIVTFSAAALAAQGQGTGGLEGTAKEQLKEQKRTNKLLEAGGGIY